MTGQMEGTEIWLPSEVVQRAVEHWVNHALKQPITVTDMKIDYRGSDQTFGLRLKVTQEHSDDEERPAAPELGARKIVLAATGPSS